MPMHYELISRHDRSLFQGKNRADGPSQHAFDLSHLVLLKPKKPPPASSNIGIWTAVCRTPRIDDIDNKLNNKITIIIVSIEQTAVHHSIQPSRGASVEYKCIQNETSYKTTICNYIVFLPLCILPTFKLPGVDVLKLLSRIAADTSSIATWLEQPHIIF